MSNTNCIRSNVHSEPSQPITSNFSTSVLESESATNNIVNNNINILNKTNNYYTANAYNKIITNKFNLSILSLNINSLNANIDKLATFLNEMKSFDIIIISETRNNIEGILNTYFPGYNFYIDYPDIKCGGIVILIKQNIAHNISNAFQIKEQHIENVVIKIQLTDKSIIYISAIYRHHSLNISDSTKIITQHIKRFPKNANIVLAGDLNIDFLKAELDTNIKAFFDKLKALNCNQLIDVPTRLTQTSKTLIDHIYLKFNRQLNVYRGVFINSVSDHLPTFTILDTKVHLNINNRPATRILNDNNIANFKASLSDIHNQTFRETTNNTDERWETFLNILMSNFNKHFPLKKISISKFKDKPWITKSIKKSSRHKEYLYKIWINTPTNYNFNKYKIYKNKFNSILKSAKKLYYGKLFENNNNKVWDYINSFKKGKKECASVECIKMGDSTLTDTNQIANAFNKFFSSIGESMNKEFNSDSNRFLEYMPPRINKSIKLSLATESEINNIVQKLSNKASAGIDMISQKMLKTISPYIIPTLTQLINVSIKETKYPKCLKLAKIIPLHKNGEKHLCSNYRPISLLSVFNKVFEKKIHNDITEFIESNNILFINQFGFRKYHNTIDALTKTHDYIINENRLNKKTIGIFIDLKKAFDSIDNEILISKLKHYGIDGPYNNLLKSYVSNRYCITEINNVRSDKQYIKFGVPQGSVLGPLLFILFINDIKHLRNDIDLNLFADDANIFCSDSTYEGVIDKCNRTMVEFDKWLKYNKLTLNVEKTHFVDFSNDKNKSNVTKNIIFRGINLNESSHTKYLGMTLQENLKWDKHVSQLINKLNTCIPLYYHIRDILPKSQKITIYNALTLSNIRYGIELYAAKNTNWTKSLQKTQNRLLKILLKQNYRASTNILHNNNKILKINDIAKLRTLLIGHKVIHQNNFANNAYTGLERRNNRHNTRNSNDFTISASHFLNRTKIIENAAVTWNALPNYIKNVENRNCFKSTVTDIFFTTYQ